MSEEPIRAIWNPIGPDGHGGLRLQERWLLLPMHWHKPQSILVWPKGDLFSDDVSLDWIDQVFAVMALSHVTDREHSFVLATARMDDAEVLAGGSPAPRAVTRHMKRLWPGLPGENAAPAWPLPNVTIPITQEEALL